jgi:hypothetical protein
VFPSASMVTAGLGTKVGASLVVMIGYSKKTGVGDAGQHARR